MRRFKGTLSGDGRIGPIEERIGRKLVRLVDPESEEGVELLKNGGVELLGPEGDCLGCVTLGDAYRELISRLEERLEQIEHRSDRGDIEEGLGMLRERSELLLSDPE
jgi:hypothetical protein